MTSQTSIELRNRSMALVMQVRAANDNAIQADDRAETMLLMDVLKQAVDLQTKISQICEATEKGKS